MTDFRKADISKQESYDLLRDWIKLVARHTNPDQDISELLGWLWKLKPATPGPTTGLVPCGCGSKAEYMHSYPFCNGGLWGVYCADDKMLGCYVQSDMTADDRGSGANVGMCQTKEEARKNWNRAMGVKEGDE